MDEVFKIRKRATTTEGKVIFEDEGLRESFYQQMTQRESLA